MAGTVATQTQAGSAKQSADVSGGGGLFSELLAELEQDVQATLDGSQLSSEPTQQGATATQGTNGTGAGASATAKNASSSNQQSPGNGQTNAASDAASAQTNWLAAWTALAQQMQQTQPAQPTGQSTGTSPLAALEAFLEGQGTPANSNTSEQPGATQDSQTPSQDASLLAALQSLAAQFTPQQQAGAQPSQGTTAASTDSTSSSTASAPTPSNAELAALLQTLTADEAAMMGAQSGTAEAGAAAQQTTATAATTTTTTPTTAANTAQPNASAPNTSAPNARSLFAQISQQVQHQSPPASVTPAQSLPTHFGTSGSNAGSQGQTSQHGANSNNSSDTQSQSASNGSGAGANGSDGSTGTTSGNSNLPIFLQAAHDQNPSQQTNLSNAAQNGNAANAVAAANAPQAPSQPQPVAATLQVAPSTSSTPAPDVNALAVSIAAQSQAGSKQFDIRLDPPELGRVDVRLTVDATGKAQAHLAVDKPQTLELLQKDSGNLARALKDSGVQLGNNGLQFSLKGQSRGGNGSRGSQSRGRQLAVTAVASNTPSTAASSSNFSASASGVDIRV